MRYPPPSRCSANWDWLFPQDEYTDIGDTVNLASRPESATKNFGVGILVSEYTYNAVRGAFPFKPMGAVQMRGRSESEIAYSLETTLIA